MLKILHQIVSLIIAESTFRLLKSV